MLNAWVLVPCQRSRLPLLRRLLESLQHPAERVMIVGTLPDPLTLVDLAGIAEHLVVFPSTEISIAKWWNLGLDAIAAQAQPDAYEVLVVSSDYVGTVHSVGILALFLRANTLAMSGPEHHSDQPQIFRRDSVRSAYGRVPGACFMLAGEFGSRADENFRWWYTDDDFEMQARHLSAVGIVPGTGLVSGPDTPLSEQCLQWAQEDRARYVAKWGKEPW